MSRRARELAIDLARITIFACFFACFILGDTCVAHATEIRPLDPQEGKVGEEVELFVYLDGPGHEFVVYWDTPEKEVKREAPSPGTTGYKTTFLVPEAAKGRHYVTVKDLATYTTHQVEFIVLPSFELTSSIGVVGAELLAKGKGWAEKETNISLIWNEETIKSGLVAKENGNWEIKFNVPETAKGDYKIHAFGSVTSRDEIGEATFKVRPAVSLAKTQGHVGSSVTARGTGFAQNEANIKLIFGGKLLEEDPVTANIKGSWSADFKIIETPRSKYPVLAEGGETKGTEIYEVPEIEVLSCVKVKDLAEHAEVRVPNRISIEGTGYLANQEVTVQYDGHELKDVKTTDEKGSFVLIFNVPDCKSVGTIPKLTVRVIDESGKGSEVRLPIDSTPPSRPTLLSPPDGTRIMKPFWGDEHFQWLFDVLGGKMKTVSQTSPLIFRWTKAEDISEVTYRLEIDSEPSFSSDDYIPFDVEEDAQQLKIDIFEQLPANIGLFYWRVQAEDAACNKGQLSGSWSLVVGRPWWISTIMIIVYLVLFAVFIVEACRKVQDLR